MPESPSFRQNAQLNRSSLLQYVALLGVGLAIPACVQGGDTQVELVAEQAAALESDLEASSARGSNVSLHNDDEDSGDEECLVPGPFRKYHSGEKAFVFKSTPNAAFPYYDPNVCNAAPFVPTFSAGGRMTSMLYRLDKAKVGNPEQEEIGWGTLCIQIQDFTFTPFGPPLLAYGQVKVNNFTITVNGTCTVTNSNTPQPGVSQMACALPVVAPIPTGYAGGLLTTNSVLNLAGVPGISGGSILALHLYKATEPLPIQLVALGGPGAVESDDAQNQSILPGATIW